MISRALTHPEGLPGVTIDDEATELIIAGGDARRALTALEAAAGLGPQITGDMRAIIPQVANRYDRDGDMHYDITSALIKRCGKRFDAPCTTWPGSSTVVRTRGSSPAACDPGQRGHRAG